MSFKKIITSQSQYVVGNFSNIEENKLFPPGFEYRLGGIVYTVKEDCTKDTGAYARKVITSEGVTEIMTLETIKKDLQESDSQILNDPLEKKENNNQSQEDEKEEDE